MQNFFCTGGYSFDAKAFFVGVVFVQLVEGFVANVLSCCCFFDSSFLFLSHLEIFRGEKKRIFCVCAFVLCYFQAKRKQYRFKEANIAENNEELPRKGITKCGN